MSDSLRVTIMSAIADTVNPGSHDDIAGAVDAIIDSLGLTRQWSYRFEGGDDRYLMTSTDDIKSIGLYGPLDEAIIESRIVGKWETE